MASHDLRRQSGPRASDSDFWHATRHDSARQFWMRKDDPQPSEFALVKSCSHYHTCDHMHNTSSAGRNRRTRLNECSFISRVPSSRRQPRRPGKRIMLSRGRAAAPGLGAVLDPHSGLPPHPGTEVEVMSTGLIRGMTRSVVRLGATPAAGSHAGRRRSVPAPWREPEGAMGESTRSRGARAALQEKPV